MAGYRVRRRPPVGEVADIVPTAERHNHGIVERLEQTIGDSSGRPSRPYRFVDTLAAMERRGSITAGMRQAGEDFRDRFAIAQLDPLRAFDTSRLRIGSGAGFRSGNEPGSRIENAREAVWHAILAVGGLRLLCLARLRLATVAEGMGPRAGVERAARQPGGSVRHPDRLTRRTRSPFR
jgi:hypothetical protein